MDALRSLIRDRTGIVLERVPPPDGQSALGALRATYAGGGTDEQLTVLDFYEPDGAATAVGEMARPPKGVEVMRRETAVMLYTREDGVPDRTPLLRSALEDATGTD